MKKVMIVEDDPGIQDAIRMMLEDIGLDTVILQNGSSILDSSCELPDLYVLDKQIPGTDGLEVCRFLKEQDSTRHLPIIMLSASPHIKKQAVAAGADLAIEKPYTVRILREAIVKLLPAG